MNLIKQIYRNRKNWQTLERQSLLRIISLSMDSLGFAFEQASAGESGIEIIRIPCGPKGYETFQHEKILPFSMKKVREDAEAYLYNLFTEEGFRVKVKFEETFDTDLGIEYWRSIRIYWNASDKANRKRGKRPTRSSK